MPKVSFIILTYNSAHHIAKLLESIFSFLDSEISNNIVEIVIVDNDSTDDTLIVAKKVGKSKVKIIETGKNFGFAKGINIGAKGARGKYLLFINPDCEWRKGSIDHLVSIFEQDSQVGVVGGKIINREGKYEKSAGRFLKTFEVMFLSVGLDELFGVRSSPSSVRQVDYVSGGFMVVKKDLFEKMGGFDESMFMYIEDMEFCYRVKKEDLKVLFDPSVEIIHEGQGSSSRGFAIRNIYKGLLYFHRKHGSPLSYSLVKLMLMTIARLLVALGKIVNNRYLTDTYSEALKA